MAKRMTDAGPFGRTIADLLAELLADWRRALAAAILSLGGLTAILLILTAFQYGTGRDWEAVSPVGSISVRTGGQEVCYFGMHPYGWQSTGIAVKQGRVMFLAFSGSVNVDLEGQIARTIARKQLEAQVKKALNLDPGKAGPGSTPEEHYTSLQIAALAEESGRSALLPDGPTFGEWRGRSVRRVVPSAPLGAVIGQIRAGQHSSEPFVLARGGAEIQVPVSGYLWLTVNDVVFDPVPDLFFADNLGAYLVTVRIR